MLLIEPTSEISVIRQGSRKLLVQSSGVTERQSRERQPRDWALDRRAFGTLDAKFSEPGPSIESRAEQRAAQIQNDIVARARALTESKFPTYKELAISDGGVGLSESALRRVMRGEAPIQVTTATALGIVAAREILCGPREYERLQRENQRLKNTIAAYQKHMTKYKIPIPRFA